MLAALVLVEPGADGGSHAAGGWVAAWRSRVKRCSGGKSVEQARNEWEGEVV